MDDNGGWGSILLEMSPIKGIVKWEFFFHKKVIITRWMSKKKIGLGPFWVCFEHFIFFSADQ